MARTQVELGAHTVQAVRVRGSKAQTQLACLELCHVAGGIQHLAEERSRTSGCLRVTDLHGSAVRAGWLCLEWVEIALRYFHSDVRFGGRRERRIR